MTDQVNSTLKAAEDLVRETVWKAANEYVLTQLFTWAPFFALWPFGPIIRAVVGKYAGELFEGFRLFVDLGAISMLDAKAKATFDHESVKLKIIARDHGIDSPEFKKAREDAKAALSDFLKFRG